MDDKQSSNFQGALSELRGDIEEFTRKYGKRHRGNFHLNWILIVIGLLLAAGVTISGMLNQGIIAAILGVCIGFLIGLQNAFPLSEKAEFYRLVVTEAENLIFELKYEVESEQQFREVVNKFQGLRDHAAKSLPRGQGMEAVKDMYKELSSE
jgi:hypothetical protein